MGVEEFYKTRWAGDPEKCDKFWKCAARFSYDDLIAFAEDYQKSKKDELLEAMFLPGFRIDFVIHQLIEQGVGKLLLNPADAHDIRARIFDINNGRSLQTP